MKAAVSDCFTVTVPHSYQIHCHCCRGQRSCFFNMNPVQKRQKWVPSKPRSAVSSHEALQAPTASAGGGAEHQEEEEGGYLLVEEDTTDSSLIITMEDSQEVKAARRRVMRKRKRKPTEEEEEEDEEVEVEIDKQLDQSLESKSKQHNLTSVNVRNIIHEVITNEHVVAMMKAAINETEAVPPFEPKMTRSKFKEVVEKGVVIPAWNISPIKKACDLNKPPQFVDIPLAEEDSSDEEYCPDEEEDDETAEDTFQESDMESTASSPRGSRLNRVEDDSCSLWKISRSRSRRLRAGSGSMGPPPPPKALPPKAVTDSTFLEKLHAVEEELAVCMEPYQPLSESEDEVSLMAYRTRSKRPLRDVPLGRLEAELRAPDITPDMYDSSSAPEDREWTDWLRGLMSSDMDNEDECDDEDDPEYNFLADIDEPDLEDYRDDKAVRITKKEVNELMEELFETLKEDLAGQEVEDEGHEEEEEPQTIQTHTPEEQHNTGPSGDMAEDGPITQLRTVKQQLALIRRRQQTQAPCYTHIVCAEPYTLRLDLQQKARLQQHLQQHIQLLTQVHLLASPVAKLCSEAETTRQFLFELDVLAQRSELLMCPVRPGFCSIFRASNLQGALQLLEELRQTPISYQPQHHLPDARGHMRCYPIMPADLAWLFATRPVFLYPELLPCASLDPALYCPRRTSAFTAAEDCLLVLGLRNMEGSCDPTKLVSQFLLRKTLVQVRRRILQCCRPGFPDNIVKAYRYQRVLWPMPVACSPVDAGELRPPVEREERVMPLWLVRSLPIIYLTIKHSNGSSVSAPEALPPCRGNRPRQSHLTFLRSASNTYSFPPGTRYPPLIPKYLDFRRIGFVLLQQPLPPPPTDPSPLPEDRIQPCSQSPPSTPPSTCSLRAPSPPQVFLRRLLLTRPDPHTFDIACKVSMATREKIFRHYQTLAGLRRGREDEDPSQVIVTDDIIRINDMEGEGKERKEESEEEEEESEVFLALSESSSSATGSIVHEDNLADCEEGDSEREVEVNLMPSRENEDDDDDDDDGRTSSDESRASVLQLQRNATSDGTDDEDEEAEAEDVAFAQDYLLRQVCDTVQVCPGLCEQLLQVLDQFSAAGPLGDPECLYDRLSCMLQPWPQLLRDFAAFLNQQQASRCGLLLEQQLFERSRRLLWRLRRSLGESSSLYQKVVSVLQESPAPPREDMMKISSLLKYHPNLQEEVWGFFQRLHHHLSETSLDTTERDSVYQTVPDRKSRAVGQERNIGKDGENKEQPVCAKNISMTSSGEKVVIWTREADRTILTACQQRGASRKTFRQVSAQLGNKTTQQSTCCSSEGQPISRQEAAPD
ncbi:GON-4-like protein isoform X3 [Channa argus]|uniref:GON-4-like protein isoform X3 n=1 Tax=Channa argus TaxID=215402 RepID=UPI0035218A1F